MTGGANPGSPRLLFAASVQGLVGFIHHSIKKKSTLMVLTSTLSLWFNFDLLILHQRDVVLLKHAKN